MNTAIRRTRRTIDIEAEAKAFCEARSAATDLLDGKFRTWERRIDRNPEMKDDLFITTLRAKYRADYDREMGMHVNQMMQSLLNVCRAHRLRFVSVWRTDLIGFEGLRISTDRSGWSQPPTWVVAEKLGINAGAYNGPQAQVHLALIPPEWWGTYDLRHLPYKKIGQHLTVRCYFDVVDGPFNTDDIEGHLRRCASIEGHLQRCVASE